MQNLQIDAADTLFFRDGRPFTMGEDTYAESNIYPPMPSVIYGTLRTAYLSENMGKFSLDELIEKSEVLSIKNIALRTSSEDVFYPMPKDLVVPKKENSKNKAKNLELISNNSTSSIQTSSVLLNEAPEKVKDEDFIISSTALRDYLDRYETEINVEPLKDYLLSETKLGIGRNNETRISSDGLLYRIGMIRPQIGISVGFENLEIKSKGYLQLGGEKKIAFSSNIDDSLEIPCPEIDSEMFKIYLATPAIFKCGWKPADLLKKYDLELLTAALGKPINIGGWDVKMQKPKTMLKAVPAGSVFYVKAKSVDLAQSASKQIFKQKSISEYADSSKQGFGLVFIGKI